MRKVRRLLKENWIPIVVGMMGMISPIYDNSYVSDINVGNKNEEENL